MLHTRRVAPLARTGVPFVPMMDRSLPVILRGLPVCAALAVASWVAPASAQDSTPRARGKRFRLHADTEFFGFTHIDDETGMDPVDTNIVGFGIGRPPLLDTNFFVRPVWGVGFGYAFLQQRAVVGARLAFAVDGIFDDDDVDDDSTTLVAGLFVPYFRWIFLPGRTFRPYVEGRFGLGGSTSTFRAASDTRMTTSTIYPTVGAGGGVHIFIIDAFSVDLGLNVDYLAPHSKTTNEVMGMIDEGDFEQDSNVVNLAALAGFSVWFD